MERIVKFYIVFPLMLVAYLGLNWYAGRWLTKAFSLTNMSKLLPLIFVAIGLLAMNAMRLRAMGSSASDFFVQIGYAWLGGILPVCFVFACADLLRFILGKFGFLVPVLPYSISSVLVAVFLLLLSFYGGLKQPSFVNIEVKSARVPKSLDGYRIIQLSDLHLDSAASMKRFKKTMDRVTAQNADLILLTGDEIDPGVKTDEVGFFNALKAKDGVYGVFGNHEYYFGMEESAEVFEKFGLKLLHNQSIDTPKLRITGLGDIKSEGMSEETAASYIGLKPELPEIVLTHQPVYYKKFAEKGAMLTLSGHTHKGQIFPFHIAVKIAYPYFYGHYTIGDAHFYVTSGAGSWGPRMRLFAATEIPIITLKSLN